MRRFWQRGESSNQDANANLQRVTKRVNRLGDPNIGSTPRPLLTLTEFFDGNDSVGSIAANLNPTPTPAGMRAVLQRIADRSDVNDVLVQVSSQDSSDEWPYSDTVWIITSAAASEIGLLVPPALASDEVYEDWDDPLLPQREDYVLPAGMKAVGLWWD